jgi:hypothetical protein
MTPPGACCYAPTGCAQLVPSICAASGGVPNAAPDCEPNPCAPELCRGDSDCDRDVDFDDIDFFVAALGGASAWTDAHLQSFGHPPTCTYAANDVDGDGQVDFDDIDPVVARLGANCSR